MQRHRGGQLEEELMKAKGTAAVADRTCREIQQTKNAAADRGKIEATSNAKVTDVSAKQVNVLRESLSNPNNELKTNDQTTRELEARLVQKDASLEKVKRELSNVKSSEALRFELLTKSEKRIQELEKEVEKGKEFQVNMIDSFAAQTKQLEQTKILLEESNLEIGSLCNKIKHSENSSPYGDKLSLQELTSTEFESQPKTAWDQDGKNLVKEIELLKDELRLAMAAEDNSKKAMDDLALALKEVTTEANHTKETLKLTQEELENSKNEAKNLKNKLKTIKDEYKFHLEEAKKEASLHKNMAERLRIEADESLLAWNGKEKCFIDCIKRAEDEKAAALQENAKLIELLTAAENRNHNAKDETHKLRDIVKQALNEANVAREAAGIAQTENSQLKDVIAEKENALEFITRENENLKINEVEAFESIKELKRMISDVSVQELESEEKQNEEGIEQHNETNEEHNHSKNLSNTFSFSLKDLTTHSKQHKDENEDQRTPDTTDQIDKDEFRKEYDPLGGSMVDNSDTSVAAAAAAAAGASTIHVHKKNPSSPFVCEKQ